MSTEIIWLALIVGLVTLAAGGLAISSVLRIGVDNPEIERIGHAIQEGAVAYISRSYRTLAVVAVILAVVLALAVGLPTALAFLFGGALSALAGYAGMMVAVRANMRVAQVADRYGLRGTLRLALRGGAVTGLFVIGLGLTGIAILLLLRVPDTATVGFAFGASLISIFARLGGGIYTKAADVGADLVGKVEQGLPEDDPRNPAVIADNVGDNVGDDAGMAADLFETFVVTLVGSLLLAHLVHPGQPAFGDYILLLGAAGAVAAILGAFVNVSTDRPEGIMPALYGTTAITLVFASLLFLGAALWMGVGLRLFLAALLGVVVTAVLILVTDFFTSKKYGPIKRLAESTRSGPATVVISGTALGFRASFVPALVIAAATLAAYQLGGIYGIGVAVTGMLALVGFIITLDAYGPITDNAGGIAEMAGLKSEVRKITDALDAVGNTTKAVTKGYAIGSAALGALVLFGSFVHELAGRMAGRAAFDLSNPFVIVGLLLGAVLPFLFASYGLEAVGRAALGVVEEVRRQLRQRPGILQGTERPDYGRTVDIVTAGALRSMTLPALIPVLAPPIVGFGLGSHGWQALGGLLLGTLVSGFFLALYLTTSGAAWDNAKKYIEDGAYGGKGTPEHAAAVVGDTIGDPFKDTAGPAINPLIKIVNVVALLIVPLLSIG
ncbi:MAG: sodium-translocating pyrophosphatase [Bacillota bacterium]|nr:sodium-translocating pyrophosphatase [Bacillota bacterium]